ncbi:aminomethyl-transferring glycine dehydrogenase subunit GcvPA [bacterium]|nr:aminomethyl-transferring glycine dehydrogenase subunit GcvPA [bacterium]MBU1636314.1 aminomethyl-transferring glycine dehydrogenase subunit GcvPA [bacterium]MBU1920012.1 aminomethyl-transferring glycine dehydrogenase subunit GcvPA [bacterium]
MRYIPNTPDDREAMLREIGVSHFNELIESIPESLRLKSPLKLPNGKSEGEVKTHMIELARKNRNATSSSSFVGAGSYDHFIPSAVNALASRSEFATAYTPYQPEVAQGTLQVIYEFQSMICELFGMEAANASMYDAGTALAEAVMLTFRSTKRSTIIIPDNIHPSYRRVTKTLTRCLDLNIIGVPCTDGKLDVASVEKELSDQTAALVLQYPNFYGIVENIEPFIQLAHSNKSLAIIVADPLAMGVLEAPGSFDADIVVGEGQGLGNPQSYGGPYLGLFAAKQKFARMMPGRIVGVTKDVDGRRGFVLTLQTREQHIRRDKATSNICTNEGLCATRATFFMSLIGPSGLRDIGNACMRRTAYLRDELARIKGFSCPQDGPHFKEFLLRIPGNAESFFEFMAERGILSGVPLSQLGLNDPHGLLVAVTENRTQTELDAYISLAKTFSKEYAHAVPASA